MTNKKKFHRVIKDVLVQAGDLEYGKKDNINYSFIYIGSAIYILDLVLLNQS